MTFEEAKEVRFTFGKYAGKSVDEIASTDEGLLYLDWIAGQWQWKADRYKEERQALAVYLEDPSIAKEVMEAIEKKQWSGNKSSEY